ncbi:MAG: hypothetical protein JKY81_02475 [Colwellia sp.]|nr:hypothetical protein [Colwellia sp.]
MSIELFQLGTIGIFFALTFLFVFCIKKGYYRQAVSVVVITLLAVFFNPLRFTQEGGASLERGVKRFEVVEKVVVEDVSFNQKQLDEMSNLKQQSKDLENEINN